jgi:hypothetical protein
MSSGMLRVRGNSPDTKTALRLALPRPSFYLLHDVADKKVLKYFGTGREESSCPSLNNLTRLLILEMFS